ncbi:hypothetical protein [Granulicella mallensis]|uniref:Uncharacterized protein n=1 Tax=Granulicella mallensis (strain ATCC BAA-1857 / DSM 23137 / MP5ACTX8) TaxID=682795 RepID=G8NRE8_GRAMM|nr:hypothetical protein [Granulicella mallensis]AEU37306.1 hypothetical protein AciX8_3003 [Granulicella mallensis MP5ACTX8]
MATSSRVCILSDGEAEELRAGRPIYCHQHKHVSADEAFGMTAPLYMQRNGKAAEPVAEWVGPRQVRYILQHTWQSVNRSFLPGGKSLRIKTKQLKTGFA